MHLAQVTKTALDYGFDGTPRDRLPEESYPDVTLDGKMLISEMVLAGARVDLAAGVPTWVLKRR